MPTVTVCIVTFNSSADILSCLEAVNAQKYSIASIIVVDNASSDQTAAVVKGYRSVVPLTLIENRFNNGFAGGQNQAIALADSDYVLVLNPDVRLDPDYVPELVVALENNQSWGSATGQLLLEDRPDLIDSTGIEMGLARQAYDRGAGEEAAKWHPQGTVFGVSGAAAMYARRMIEDIAIEGEFYDEHYFAYKEDVDVAWRARLLGWEAGYVPAAKALHARGWKKGGRSSVPLFIRQHSYMNRFFTLIKNEQVGWHLLGRAPLIVALELLKLVYILLREPRLLACLPQLCRLLPVMLNKRKWISRKIRER